MTEALGSFLAIPEGIEHLASTFPTEVARSSNLWSVYIGWLMTRIADQGEALNQADPIRTSTAFSDHNAAKLVGQVA